MCQSLAYVTRDEDRATQLLVQLVKDPVWSVWWQASWSLGQMAVKSIKARWALQALSNSESGELRERAERGAIALRAGGRGQAGFLQRIMNADERRVRQIERNQAEREAVAAQAMRQAFGKRPPDPAETPWSTWADLAQAAWSTFDGQTEPHGLEAQQADEFLDMRPARLLLRAAEAHAAEAIDWARHMLSSDAEACRHRGLAWLQRLARLDPERVFRVARDLFAATDRPTYRDLARLLEGCLAARPARAHLWLREIVGRYPGHRAIARLAATARIGRIGNLCRAYAAVAQPGRADAALASALAVLAECRAYESGEALLDLYRVLRLLLEPTTLAQLPERRDDLARLLDAPQPPVDECVPVLRQLHTLAGLAAKSLQAHEDAGETQYMKEALDFARQIEPAVARMPAVPEKPVLAEPNSPAIR